jgi:hypothetical protein
LAGGQLISSVSGTITNTSGGSTGQFLSYQGAGAVPAWTSVTQSQWTELASYQLTGGDGSVTSVEFKNGVNDFVFDTTYGMYRVVGFLKPSTANDVFMQLYSGGALVANNYYSCVREIPALQLSNNASTTKIQLHCTILSISTFGFQTDLSITGVGLAASLYGFVHGESYSIDNGNTYARTQIFAARNSATLTVDGFRFYPPSGGFTTAKLKVFGSNAFGTFHP